MQMGFLEDVAKLAGAAQPFEGADAGLQGGREEFSLGHDGAQLFEGEGEADDTLLIILTAWLRIHLGVNAEEWREAVAAPLGLENPWVTLRKKGVPSAATQPCLF